MNSYLKYKNKYLNLKNKFNLIGGSEITEHIICDDLIEILDGLNLNSKDIEKYISQKIIFKVNPTKVDNKAGGLQPEKIDLNLYSIELNKDKEDILFIVPGLSNKSFKNSVKIISNNFCDLSTKFKKIYLINYSSFINLQTAVCNTRDLIIETFDEKYKKFPDNLDKEHIENFKMIYTPELYFNKRIAKLLHEIVLHLKLNNVYLLGKSNGAWITKLILDNSEKERYKGLYLCTPAIPDGIDGLKIPNDEFILRIFFIKQDGYFFRFYGKSNEEICKYENQIGRIKNVEIIEIDNRDLEHKDKYHELNDEMFDLIIKSLRV
jgi:hypothetical protein